MVVNHKETNDIVTENLNNNTGKNEIIDIFEGNKDEDQNHIPKVSYIINRDSLITMKESSII